LQLSASDIRSAGRPCHDRVQLILVPEVHARVLKAFLDKVSEGSDRPVMEECGRSNSYTVQTGQRAQESKLLG
jgi:hypothetical protein